MWQAAGIFLFNLRKLQGIYLWETFLICICNSLMKKEKREEEKNEIYHVKEEVMARRMHFTQVHRLISAALCLCFSDWRLCMCGCVGVWMSGWVRQSGSIRRAKKKVAESGGT